MILGYARVSTHDQNLDRQIDQLQQVGCERIFREKASGSKKERPELDNLLDHPPKPKKAIELALKLHKDNNLSISEIEKATGVSKSSLYRYLNGKRKPICDSISLKSDIG